MYFFLELCKLYKHKKYDHDCIDIYGQPNMY